MLKTFNISLDLKDKTINSPFQINQNDLNTIEVDFVLTKNKQPVDLTGVIPRLVTKKPSNYTVVQDCEITDVLNGKFKVTLNTQAYIETGLHVAEVYLYEGTQKVAVTNTFSYVCNKAILNDKTVNSTNEWQSINDALIQIDDSMAQLEGGLATLPNKVDKVPGKDLSTNDYNNTEKAEVAKVKDKADKTYVDTQLADKAPKKKTDSWVDVMADYGAKGDGVTDDTAAFTAAFNYLQSAGGGIVLVPEGIFKATVKIPSHCGIEGVGEKSIIQSPANATTHCVQTFDSTTKFATVKNITIDGNKTNQTNTVHGLYLFGSQTASYDASYFNLGDAFYLVQNVKVINCKGNGLHVDSRGESIFNNIHSLNNDGDGFYINAADSMFNTCSSGQNKGNGFTVLLSNNRLTNIKGWNNGIGNTGMTGGYGIYMYGASHCLVQGEMQGNLLDGVYVKTGELNIIDIMVDTSGQRDAIQTTGVNGFKLENALRNTIRGSVNNRPDRSENKILYAVGLYGSSIANHIRLTGHYMATGNVYVDAGASFATTNDIVFYGTNLSSTAIDYSQVPAMTTLQNTVNSKLNKLSGDLTSVTTWGGVQALMTEGDVIVTMPSKLNNALLPKTGLSYGNVTITMGTGGRISAIITAVLSSALVMYVGTYNNANGTMLWLQPQLNAVT